MIRSAHDYIDEAVEQMEYDESFVHKYVMSFIRSAHTSAHPMLIDPNLDRKKEKDRIMKDARS